MAQISSERWMKIRWICQKPDFLPGTETLLNYHFLGDGAFPLSDRMMKPVPGYKLSKDERISNYRISRGRRVVENFFAILAATWRCLLWGLEVKEQNADWIIKATVVLQNFLLDEMKPGNWEFLCLDLADTWDEDDGLWRNLTDNPQIHTASVGSVKKTADKLKAAAM
uniref:DDE Tnp4 domain-containing protein n=1 Tax=Ditylenchus dipsaci TaxID=166011 RepID=A0A915D030_9BILA